MRHTITEIAVIQLFRTAFAVRALAIIFGGAVIFSAPGVRAQQATPPDASRACAAFATQPSSALDLALEAFRKLGTAGSDVYPFAPDAIGPYLLGETEQIRQRLGPLTKGTEFPLENAFVIKVILSGEDPDVRSFVTVAFVRMRTGMFSSKLTLSLSYIVERRSEGSGRVAENACESFHRRVVRATTYSQHPELIAVMANYPFPSTMFTHFSFPNGDLFSVANIRFPYERRAESEAFLKGLLAPEIYLQRAAAEAVHN